MLKKKLSKRIIANFEVVFWLEVFARQLEAVRVGGMMDHPSLDHPVIFLKGFVFRVICKRIVFFANSKKKRGKRVKKNF